VTVVQAVPSCPDGHGAMVLRHSRTGDFYSCGTYPACKRSAPIPLDLECPRCQAPLVIRMARKTQQRFTGCSAYPACTFAVWAVPHVCSTCGGPCLGEGEREAPEPRRGARPGGLARIRHDEEVPF